MFTHLHKQKCVHTRTRAHRTSHSTIMGIDMELVPPLCCNNSLHSSGKVFYYMSEHCCGTCFHSATRALVWSCTGVGRLGLASSPRSNSSQRCLMGLRSGLCAGQSSSFTPISTNHFSMDLALYTGALSC